MCQCAVAVSQRAVVCVACEVDMCGIGRSNALPTHFMAGPDSGHMVCPAGSQLCILPRGAFSILRDLWPQLEPTFFVSELLDAESVFLFAHIFTCISARFGEYPCLWLQMQQACF